MVSSAQDTNLFPLYMKALVLIILLLHRLNLAGSYDPLDPNGNITVRFDIHHWTSDGYVATVSIQNYYQYRHIEEPGWELSWTWTQGEVIWSMTGAMATHQGNCSSFDTQVPHCCREDPAIIDLAPNTLPINRSAHCCRNGVLTALGIDQSNSFSAFEMIIGNIDGKAARMPSNLTLMVPSGGYACGPLVDTKPTVVLVAGGLRKEQVFRTWEAGCTYSAFVANKAPVCCVSLSTFYNPSITPCPACSCGCRTVGDVPPPCVGDDAVKEPLERDILRGRRVGCSGHMCPVRVHWHVKSNYRKQWRVKVTVSNYDFANNYSDWNLVIQHPGFNTDDMQAFSFNSTRLPTLPGMDEAVIFWGLEHYNALLLHADTDQLGSVTTELLLNKNMESFTLSNGWVFPRRIYFNGDDCEMPMPDDFPGLPNTSSRVHSVPRYLAFLLLFLLYLLELVLKS